MAELNEAIMQAVITGIEQWALKRGRVTSPELKAQLAVILYKQFEAKDAESLGESSIGTATSVADAVGEFIANSEQLSPLPSQSWASSVEFLRSEIRSAVFGLGALILSVLMMLLSVQIEDHQHRQVSVWASLAALFSSIVFLDLKFRKMGKRRSPGAQPPDR